MVKRNFRKHNLPIDVLKFSNGNKRSLEDYKRIQRKDSP